MVGPVLLELLREETFFPARVAASGATLRIAMVALESGVRFPPDRRGIDNEDRDAREAEEVRPGVP